MTPSDMNELATREAYDREPVTSPEDARQLACAISRALLLGETPAAREAGFLLWLLRPLTSGELQPQALPFKRKRGERKNRNTRPDSQGVAYRVHALRQCGESLISAVSIVARHENERISVRNIYERFSKERLAELDERACKMFAAIARREALRHLGK